jgi:ADP-heptose:LPS heptosyltransferase
VTNTFISWIERYLGFLGCALLSTVRRMTGIFGLSGDPNIKSNKIVFVKFIEQGALLLHQNTFKEAAKLYGSDKIYLCTFRTNEHLVGILDLVPAANRIYINEKNLFRFSIDFFTSLGKLRKEKVDTVIDLEFFSRATAIFCFLSGTRKRAGYHRFRGSQNYRGDLFTHRLNYSHYVHVGDSSWYLLKSIEMADHDLPALDIESGANAAENRFVPDANDLLRINKLVGTKDPRPLIVINPSLNDVLPPRKWPEENFRKFVTLYNVRFPGYRFVFTGRPDEREVTDQFIATLNLPDAINLCGKTELRDILTLYTQAKLLLTSDSGPAHFSSLTPIHTIVLFGPETPVLYAPRSIRTYVIYKSLPCSPCYNVYNNRQSPCSNNLCMQKISVDEVIQLAEQILAVS